MQIFYSYFTILTNGSSGLQVTELSYHASNLVQRLDCVALAPAPA